MKSQIKEFFNGIKSVAEAIATARLDRRQLETMTRLAEFNASRAAYVAQTSLYGYLKTRMGTRYVELFQDDTYVSSINQAKWRVFAACLEDLTIYTSAIVEVSGGLAPRATPDFALASFRASLASATSADTTHLIGADAVDRFAARANLTSFASAHQGETAFGRSPEVLVEAAPIIEDFKMLDAEIVKNSMRFRWQDVRRQVARRLDAAALANEWQARA